MNNADDRITPRWLKDGKAEDEPLPSPSERTVLAEVLCALRGLRHGTVQLAIQDGRVVQIDVTEKRRL